MIEPEHICFAAIILVGIPVMLFIQAVVNAWAWRSDDEQD